MSNLTGLEDLSGLSAYPQNPRSSLPPLLPLPQPKEPPPFFTSQLDSKVGNEKAIIHPT
jgi:hypothetical protein